MSEEIEIYIKDNQIRFIYNDKLVNLFKMGKVTTKRASHVEPAGDKWEADMGPSGGPVLGPFRLRKDALDAEVKWLINENIPT